MIRAQGSNSIHRGSSQPSPLSPLIANLLGNAYGYVSAGLITVKGELFQAIVVDLERSQELVAIGLENGQEIVLNRPFLLIDGGAYNCSWDHDEVTMRELGIPSVVYCLQIFKFCYVILQCVDEEGHIYRRRGYTGMGPLGS